MIYVMIHNMDILSVLRFSVQVQENYFHSVDNKIFFGNTLSVCNTLPVLGLQTWNMVSIHHIHHNHSTLPANVFWY